MRAAGRTAAWAALLCAAPMRSLPLSMPATLDPAASNFTDAAETEPDEPDACASSVIADAEGALWVFALGRDGNLHAKQQHARHRSHGPEGWSAWSSLGAVGPTRPGGPVATALPGGVLIVAVCDGKGRMRTRTRQPGAAEWDGWQLLDGPDGGGCAFAPSLIVDGGGRLHAFTVAASDKQVLHGVWAQPLPRCAAAECSRAVRGAWSAVGGRATASPIAELAADGGISVVVRGALGALFSRSLPPKTGGVEDGEGEWGRWQVVPGRVRGSPALTRRPDAPALLELYGRGLDSAAWRLYQKPMRPPPSAIWAPRAPLGGVLGSAPAAAVDRNGRVHVVALGPDGTVWHRQQRPRRQAVVSVGHSLAGGGEGGVAAQGGFEWSEWRSLGGEAATVPVAAIGADGLLAVVVGAADGNLYLKPQRFEGGEPVPSAAAAVEGGASEALAPAASPAGDAALGWGEWELLGGPVRAFTC